MTTLTAAIPIVISAIALIISIVTYASSIKPANITLFVGEWMEVYHDKDQALYIHLPIVFQNTGARAGVVRSLGLILRDPGTKQTLFIKWMGFKIPTDQTWVWESNGTPVSIPGASDMTKMAEFYGAESVAGWIPKPIDYELYLLAWTSDSQAPSQRCEVKWTFNVKDVAAVRLNLETVRAGGAVSSRWVIRSGYAPDSKKLSEAEFDELVRS